MEALLGLWKRRRANVAPFRAPMFSGLSAAGRLREAAARRTEERASALAQFHDFWFHRLAPALEREEAVLLRVAPNVAHRERLLRDLRLLRAMAAQARRFADRGVADRVWVGNLANRVEDHFRWLDREVLPDVERRVDPDRLALLVLEHHRSAVVR